MKEIGAEAQPLLAKFGAAEDWADPFPYRSSRLRDLPWQQIIKEYTDKDIKWSDPTFPHGP